MDTMRDALDAAFESNTDDETPEGVSDTGETTEEIITPVDDTDSVDEGAEGDTAEKPEADATPESEEAPAPDADTAAADEAPSGDAEEAGQAPADKRSMKAPVGWSPKQREDWSKIPRHLQERVTQDLADSETYKQETSMAKGTHDAMVGLANKYGHIMQHDGMNNPIEAADVMFQNAAVLRNGTQEQKSALMAQLITHYNVDINALDSALVAPAPAQPDDARFTTMLNDRLAPLQHQLEGYQNQGRQAVQTEVKQFADTAEFLGDVRMDMADLIDMAAKQGRHITMQDAYDKACALNPDVSAVIKQRADAATTAAAAAQVANKRNAASSLNGRKSGLGGNNSNPSLRDTLATAWDDQG